MLLLLSPVLAVALGSAEATPSPPTRRDLVVYLVRHAEKQSNGRDPALSPAGVIRAKRLAHTLSLTSLDAVFATQFLRSEQTGKAVASSIGLPLQRYHAQDTGKLARRLIASYSKPARKRGGRVLVVGHSNTLDDIATALGAPGLSDLEETHYDRLIAIHRTGSAVTTELLRFGTPTP